MASIRFALRRPKGCHSAFDQMRHVRFAPICVIQTPEGRFRKRSFVQLAIGSMQFASEAPAMRLDQRLSRYCVPRSCRSSARLKDGAVCYLRKPLDEERLMGCLRTALPRAELPDEES
jgi:hypothetical protein